MAFNSENFNQSALGAISFYKDTTQTIATLTASGFFNVLQVQVTAQTLDNNVWLIYIQGSDGEGLYLFGLSGGNVTVSSIIDAVNIGLTENYVMAGNASNLGQGYAVSGDLSFAAGVWTIGNNVVNASKLANNAVGKNQLVTVYQNTIVYFVKNDADGSAAATTPEKVICRMPGAGTIQEIKIIPNASLTADNSDYANIIVSRHESDGSGKTTVCQFDTDTIGNGGTGNWSAFKDVSVALIPAGSTFVTGNNMSIEITKQGSGVIVPEFVLYIRYQFNA